MTWRTSTKGHQFIRPFMRTKEPLRPGSARAGAPGLLTMELTASVGDNAAKRPSITLDMGEESRWQGIRCNGSR
jgi:hypothetical protein